MAGEFGQWRPRRASGRASTVPARAFGLSARLTVIKRTVDVAQSALAKLFLRRIGLVKGAVAYRGRNKHHASSRTGTSVIGDTRLPGSAVAS